MDLIRWEPRRRLIRNLFDDFFDMVQSPTLARRGWPNGDMREPAIDLIDSKNELIVKAELPGVKKEDVTISLVNNSLTIKGEMEKEEETKKEAYSRRERAYGTYTRTVSLPMEIDSDKMRAKFKNGVLEISLPKKTETQSREITIEAE